MRSVRAGAPALQVVHFPDGVGWGSNDGGDPNVPDACLAAHIHHVIAKDPSMAELAKLPPGQVADRTRVRGPWTLSRWQEDDEC